MISVVLPIYNAENCLRRCIDSVLCQTCRNIEIVLIDDGSKDSSGNLCDEYAKNDNRVKVVHKENGGVSSARNKGLEVATGEYIMFLDSDDTFDPSACEVLLKTITEKKAECVICGTKEPDGNCWTPGKACDYTSSGEFRKDFVEWLDTELLSPIWNKIYKREKILTQFCQDMSFGEDLCFTLNYLKNCERISFITDTLHFHDNVKKDSLTHTFKSSRFKDIECVQTAILDFAGTGANNALFGKYVRDCIDYMYSVYSTPLISVVEKLRLLKEWWAISYLKNLDIANYHMTSKQRLMLSLWKQRRFSWYLRLLQLKRLFF